MKTLLFLLLIPAVSSAQNFHYENGKIDIIKSFRVGGKTERQIYNDIRSAITQEYNLYRVIAAEDTINYSITAFGSVSYGEKTPRNLNREASFKIHAEVDGDVYTVRLHDFSGKIKNKANSQIDYSKEYESLFIYGSEAKRKSRVRYFNNFEGAIMESLSNITGRVGISDVILTKQ